MGHGAEPAVDRSTVHEALREAMAYVLEVPKEQIGDTSAMDELGVDSLIASQVVVELEIRLEVEIDVTIFEQISPQSTVSEVAALLADAV